MGAAYNGSGLGLGSGLMSNNFTGTSGRVSYTGNVPQNVPQNVINNNSQIANIPGNSQIPPIHHHNPINTDANQLQPNEISKMGATIQNLNRENNDLKQQMKEVMDKVTMVINNNESLKLELENQRKATN